LHPRNVHSVVIRRYQNWLLAAVEWFGGRRLLRLLAVLGIVAADAVIWNAPLSQFVLGPADGILHLATAALIVIAWPAIVGEPRRIRLPTALAVSVLIDLDHVPEALFGFDFLTRDTNRPYGHTGLAIFVCGALAIALRRFPVGSSVAWGAAVGIALHLVRDMPTGGVPLGWPVTSATIGYPYPLSVLVLLVAASWPIRPAPPRDNSHSQQGD
jgi:inner membrane protein